MAPEEPIETHEESSWDPLALFPSSNWFYLTWVVVYALWGLLSFALYFAVPPGGFVDLLIDVVAVFAAVEILGSGATLIGCRFVERMPWRDALRTAFLAPLYSVGILISLISGT